MGESSIELILVRSPYDLAENSFELFFAEAFVYLTALIGAAHAWKQRKNGGSGEYMLFFAIALAAASFVDPFCLISEQIRNYFHSHASVLMWNRRVAPWQFPLFACIAYVPGAVVWQLNLPLFAETCLVVFVASWTFYCFDLFACKWLLYQWHVSDPLYAARTECVPLASSMWICTYAATASLLARLAYKQINNWGLPKAEPFDWTWWALFFICVLIFLPLHILPITFLYFPSFILKLNKEYECVWAFGLAGLVCCVGSIALDKAHGRKKPSTPDYLASLQSLVWLGSLTFVLLFIDPANVISTSVHQPYGGLNRETSALCSKMEGYLFGLSERKRYVCDEDLVHWKIESDPRSGSMPGPGDEWYTIRGLAMEDNFRNHYAASLLVAVSIHLILVVLAYASARRGKISSQTNKKMA